jgi:hypothetical protein
VGDLCATQEWHARLLPSRQIWLSIIDAALHHPPHAAGFARITSVSARAVEDAQISDFARQTPVQTSYFT